MKAPLVEVTWTDAASNHGWYLYNELGGAQTIKMTTVGYMVRQSKKDIAIAQTQSHHENVEENKWSEVWVIPAMWVKRIRRLV